MLFVICTGLASHVCAQHTDGHQRMRFYSQSQIAHDSIRYQSYEIQQGGLLVFELISDNAGEPGNHSIAETVIAFETSGGEEEFTLTNEDLQKHQAIYMQRCRCQDRGIQPIQSGEIYGLLLPNGNWRIEGFIKAIGTRTGKSYNLPINGEFKAAVG